MALRRKFIFIFGMITAILIAIAGCSPIQQSESGDQQLSDKALLKMDLSNVIGKKTYKDPSPKYYLIYQNVTKDDGIKHMLIESTDITLQVERGSVYVVGIAKKEDYIKIIGFVGKTDLAITCIPIGEDASTVVDLGKIIAKEENGEIVLEPSVSTEEFVNMIGFSEDILKLVGKADVTFKNMLNPDINRNGVIDSEERLRWYLTTFYGFYYNGTEVVDEYTYGLFKYIFGMNIDYPQEAYGEAFLLGSSDDVASLKNLDTGKKYSLAGAIISGNSYQWYFNCDASGHEDGDYRLDARGEKTGNIYSFYFDNLRFFHPHERYEGMIYPYVQGTVFSDGKIKEVSWEWYVKVDGGIRPASKEEVYILSDKRIGLAFVFSNKEQFDSFSGSLQFIVASHGVDFSENGSLSLVDEDLWIFPTYEEFWAFINGRADYEMIGNTLVLFYYRYNYLPYPSDFDENSSPQVLTPNRLVGRWYNLYYNSQNWGEDSLSIPDNKPAYLEFTPEGRVLMDWIAFRGAEYCTDVGSYEIIGENSVKIIDNHGYVYYLYIEMHDNYMEIMASTDHVPDGIDRNDPNYFIYSKHASSR